LIQIARGEIVETALIARAIFRAASVVVARLRVPMPTIAAASVSSLPH
jgi:hypothetical protein